MKYRDPLKQILAQTHSHWDHDGTRPALRQAFKKAMQCRTATLGAEVYASRNQQRIVYHTCKSRACPSCGYRATVQWQRERWAALPDGSYKGLTFTMPDVLWRLFRDNQPLVLASPIRRSPIGVVDCDNEKVHSLDRLSLAIAASPKPPSKTRFRLMGRRCPRSLPSVSCRPGTS